MRRIKIAAMILGGVAILLQIILLRSFLAIFWGNELLVGIVLVFWMLWTGLGAYFGVMKAVPRLSFALVLQLAAAGFAIILLIGLSYIRWIFMIAPGEYPGILPLVAVSALGLATPGFALGAAFHHLAALAAAANAQPAATIYVFESAGSVIGSLLFTFVLVQQLTPIPLLCLLFFLLMLLYHTLRKKRTLALIALCLLAAACPLAIKLENRLAKSYWNLLAPGARLITQANSRYGEVTILGWEDEKHLYINSLHQTPLPEEINNQAIAAVVMNQPPLPEEIHNQAIAAVVMNQTPLQHRHVLLIGGGMGGLAAELARYPQTRLTYLEMDSVAFSLSREQLTGAQRSRWDSLEIEVVFDDGRAYLLKHPQTIYDMIVVMAGRPAGAVSNRFYTEEFFTLARARLGARGMLALGHIPAGENYLGEELLLLNRSIYQGLRRAFVAVRAVPGNNALYLASPGSAITLNPDSLTHQYRAQNMHHLHFSPLMFKSLLPPERISFFTTLLDQGGGRRNLDFKPIVYYMELMVWQKVFNSWPQVSKYIFNLSYECVITLWTGGLIICLVGWWTRPPRNNQRQHMLMFVAAAAGFAAMSLDVIGIMALQTIFGAVYEQIGLALAAFMSGLACGAWLGMRWSRRNGEARLILLLAAVALFCTSLTPLLTWMSTSMSRTGFFLWMAGGGALTGAIFPFVCAIHAGLAEKYHPGVIYAADMAGGACGALGLASFFIPLYGFSQTAWLIAILMIAAMFAVGIIHYRT